MRAPGIVILIATGVMSGVAVPARSQIVDPGDDDDGVEESDSDSDGVPDVVERFLGTDPTRPDSDGDGLDDRVEVLVLRTNPLNRDTDGDGACDGGLAPGCTFGEDLDGDGVITVDESDPRCRDASAALGDEVGGSRLGCAAGGAVVPWLSALVLALLPIRRRRTKAGPTCAH